MLTQKYIIAVIGDANDGKTTTINKVFKKMQEADAITHITPVAGWSVPSSSPSAWDDFSLTGNTKYGLTGFLSRGDVVYATKSDLDILASAGCGVIICACRKQYPDTFNAVAKVSWEYGYSIIWIRFDRPPEVTKGDYTDELSEKIVCLFK